MQKKPTQPEFDFTNPDPTYIALNWPLEHEKPKLTRRAIENITKNIDQIEMRSKREYKEMLTNQIELHARDEQMQKVTDILKDIDYADPDQLYALYHYRVKDENDKIKTAREVAKEFHEGKFDPNKKEGKSKTKKKKK